MFHDFDNPQSKFSKANENPYHALLKCLPSVQEPLLDYNHLNNMRYTFVSDLFSKYSCLNNSRLLWIILETVQQCDT